MASILQAFRKSIERFANNTKGRLEVDSAPEPELKPLPKPVVPGRVSYDFWDEVQVFRDACFINRDDFPMEEDDDKSMDEDRFMEMESLNDRVVSSAEIKRQILTNIQPIYIDNNELDEETDMISFTNDDILTQRLTRDKAIIAMHLLRVTKAKGAKGVGPNREDHPLFREVVHFWLNSTPIHAEELAKIEEARSRVIKYGKQLAASTYAACVNSESYFRHEMMDRVRQAYQHQAETELVEAVKEQTYGGW